MPKGKHAKKRPYDLKKVILQLLPVAIKALLTVLLRLIAEHLLKR